MRDLTQYNVLNFIQAILGSLMIAIMIYINVNPYVILIYLCGIFYIAALFRLTRLNTFMLISEVLTQQRIRNQLDGNHCTYQRSRTPMEILKEVLHG